MRSFLVLARQLDLIGLRWLFRRGASQIEPPEETKEVNSESIPVSIEMIALSELEFHGTLDSSYKDCQKASFVTIFPRNPLKESKQEDLQLRLRTFLMDTVLTYSYNGEARTVTGDGASIQVKRAIFNLCSSFLTEVSVGSRAVQSGEYESLNHGFVRILQGKA